MAIIVCGKLHLKPDSRALFIEQSISSIALARTTIGCYDFAVSPDPIELNRVNVFEKWRDRATLEAFRATPSEHTLFDAVESFEIEEFEVPDHA